MSIQGGVREIFSEDGRREFSKELSAAKFCEKEKKYAVGETNNFRLTEAQDRKGVTTAAMVVEIIFEATI